MAQSRDPFDQDNLFPFQRRVLESLYNGRSVILQAPTGAGKTRAALFPFLKAWGDRSIFFPRRCIYSVPMRVLANQFFEEYRELTADASNTSQELPVGIQTGERPEARYFEKPLLFATIDQTLSSALGVPYGLSRGQGNLNVAAVFSSYLVFDEFHLFPRDGAFKSTLQLLRFLSGLTQFVLMTATFSGTMLSKIAELLNADVVTVLLEELVSIPSQHGKSRRFHAIDSQLTSEAVLERHHTRSIAICNTVERAQSLYESLRNHPDLGNTEVILLHSRFLREDRNNKEELVRREFGPKPELHRLRSAILVATQAIEVGLNITCENLHTEIAPANSILQRAGRCARFSGECGDVHVYQVPLTEDGRPNFAPYTEDGGRESLLTWSAIEKRNGKALTFCDEQEVIDEVHTDSDRALIENMKREEGDIWRRVLRTITLGETSERAQLIRRLDARTILVHGNPDTLRNPYACPGFSLWYGTLYGKYAALAQLAREKGLPWAIKYPVEIDRDSSEDGEPCLYEWREVKETRDFSVSPLFVVNPGIAAYDPDVGFRFTKEGGGYECQELMKGTEDAQAGFSYNLERYEEHVCGMLEQYLHRLFDIEARYSTRQLEERMGLTAGSLDRGIKLAIAAHDTGKMDSRWVTWARTFQTIIGEPIEEEGYFIAHTHYDADNPVHRSAARAANKQAGCSRPPHAGEGAIAVARLINQAVGGNEGLRRAILTAIARHHSAHLREYSPYQLQPGAEKVLENVLKEAGFADAAQLSAQVIMVAPDSDLEKLLLRTDDPLDWWMAYFLIVRILRLADRLSLQV